VVSEALRLMKKAGEPKFSTEDSAINGIGTEMAQYKQLKLVPQGRTCRCGSCALDRELQDAYRQRHQIHSDVGDGSSGASARLGDDDRLEAHRRNGRRENRKRPPDFTLKEPRPKSLRWPRLERRTVSVLAGFLFWAFRRLSGA